MSKPAQTREGGCRGRRAPPGDHLIHINQLAQVTSRHLHPAISKTSTFSYISLISNIHNNSNMTTLKPGDSFPSDVVFKWVNPDPRKE